MQRRRTVPRKSPLLHQEDASISRLWSVDWCEASERFEPIVKPSRSLSRRDYFVEQGDTVANQPKLRKPSSLTCAGAGCTTRRNERGLRHRGVEVARLRRVSDEHRLRK